MMATTTGNPFVKHVRVLGIGNRNGIDTIKHYAAMGYSEKRMKQSSKGGFWDTRMRATKGLRRTDAVTSY